MLTKVILFWLRWQMFWRWPQANSDESPEQIKKRQAMLKLLWIVLLLPVLILPGAAMLSAVVLFGVFISFAFIDEAG